MIERIQELEVRLITVSSIREKIRLLNELAWELRHTDLERLRVLSEMAYSFAHSFACDGQIYYEGIVDSLRNLAFLNLDRGNFHQALDQLLRALSMLENAPPSPTRVWLLCNTGWAYFYLGHYTQALTYFLNGLELARQLEHRPLEAQTLSLISALYNESGDPHHAHAILQQSIQRFQDVGWKDREAIALSHLAFVYLKAGDYSSALASSLKGLQIAQEHTLCSCQILNMNTIGRVYQAMGRHLEAVTYLQVALAAARSDNYRFRELCSLLELGKSFHGQGDYLQSLDYLQQGLALAEELDTPLRQSECHEWLSSVYEQLGHWQDALFHYKQFHTIKQSLMNAEVSKRLADLKVMHDIEAAKKDAEIYRLQLLHLQQEVDEHRRIQAALEHLATADPLTGLANRRHFLVRSEREFARVHQDRQPVSVLMFDIDHFKKINDTYGHFAGDQVLVTVTRLLHGHLRPSDIPSRYGGDEFVILLPETSTSTARQIAERLRDAIESFPIAYEGHTIAVTISLGVVTMSHADHRTLDDLLRLADQALYAAKQAGRNQIGTLEAKAENR